MRPPVVVALMSAIIAFLLAPVSGVAQDPLAPDWLGCTWLNGDTSISLGYWGGKDVDITFSVPAATTGSVTQLKQQFDLQAFGLEGLIRLKSPGVLGLALGAGYCFCFQTTSQETVQNAGAASLARQWKAQPQSGNVDLAITLDMYPSLTVLLGARYENFQVNFLNPNSGFGPAATLLNTANITLNAWTPYLGIVYDNAVGALGFDYRVGVKGVPVVWGQVDYMELVSQSLQVGGVAIPIFTGSNQLSQGYFVEAFGDCFLGSILGMRVGAYAKYQAINALSNVNVGERNGNVPDVIYRFELRKQIWGVGGSFSVAF